jgi:hypothetical protein
MISGPSSDVAIAQDFEHLGFIVGLGNAVGEIAKEALVTTFVTISSQSVSEAT